MNTIPHGLGFAVGTTLAILLVASILAISILATVGAVTPIEVIYLTVLYSLVIFVYFLPSIIAFRRGKPNRWSVGVLNLFLGWTFIGWVICLAMAVSGAKKRSEASPRAYEPEVVAPKVLIPPTTKVD